MKVELIKKSLIQVTAEDAMESGILLEIATMANSVVPEKKVQKKRKPRRRQTVKTCPVCNGQYRGLKLHMTKVHNYQAVTTS